MNTADFKTRSMIVQQEIPSNPKFWVLGLDIGYSSVKGMSPNKYFCFPSYAKMIPEGRTTLKEEQPSDIRYRESADSPIWTVGNLAYDEANASEVVDSEEELYGRNRYFSKMFQVISRAGLAIGLMGNSFGKPDDRNFVVQTGLPPKYEGDSGLLKESLAGHHVYQIKIGKGPWMSFDFTLSEDRIFVMPQPLGALVSASVDINGKPLPTSRKFFASNLVVFDPGFGTTDDYTVKRGNVVSWETFPEYGMKEVFKRTCRDIQEKYGVSLQIPELQNKLSIGYVKSVDRRLMKSTKHDISEILEKNCREVCREAVEKLKPIHNYYVDVDYIIAAGGTYEAWKNDFDAVFKDMEGLSIIPGNVNDERMSNIFSNVRGYYYYLNNSIR